MTAIVVIKLDPNQSSSWPRSSSTCNEATHEKQRQQAHRKINEKDPAPGIIECNPSAQRRANGGRHDRRDSVERKRRAPLLRRKLVCQNGLGHGLETATTGALQHPVEKQKAETA